MCSVRYFLVFRCPEAWRGRGSGWEGARPALGVMPWGGGEALCVFLSTRQARCGAAAGLASPGLCMGQAAPPDLHMPGLVLLPSGRYAPSAKSCFLPAGSPSPDLPWPTPLLLATPLHPDLSQPAPLSPTLPVPSSSASFQVRIPQSPPANPAAPEPPPPALLPAGCPPPDLSQPAPLHLKPPSHQLCFPPLLPDSPAPLPDGPFPPPPSSVSSIFFRLPGNPNQGTKVPKAALMPKSLQDLGLGTDKRPDVNKA